MEYSKRSSLHTSKISPWQEKVQVELIFFMNFNFLWLSPPPNFPINMLLNQNQAKQNPALPAVRMSTKPTSSMLLQHFD